MLKTVAEKNVVVKQIHGWLAKKCLIFELKLAI